MNYESQPLQRHEIASMKSDPRIIERVFTSYKLMLDFYGMRLVSEESGLVDRALPPRNYASRYQNLIRESSYRMKSLIYSSYAPKKSRVFPQLPSCLANTEVFV